MSKGKELRDTMPCGFAADTSVQLNFTEARCRPGDILPINKLSDDQKKNLAIACWSHGCWDDMFIDDRKVTKEEAIVAANEGTTLGNELVQLTMMGYEHIYDSLLPHDEEKYPLATILKDPELTNVNTDTALASFTAYNHLSVSVYIYKQETSGSFSYFGDIPTESRPVSTTPDFSGQIWLARTSADPQANILGSYMAYPGCTTWDIVSFPVDAFIPSAWNALVENVHVANNLKTFVSLYQVMPNGDLHHFGILAPGHSGWMSPCYVGSSFVAIQGNTVISAFFIDSAANTSWSMNLNVPPGGEEIYATGSNNYIFYQVKFEQDDTVTPTPKNFTKTITIESGTNLLYASLFDSSDEYFAIPQGVGVAIESTTASGSTHYNTNTNTDSLYIQMTADGQSLRKLCVKNPAAGQWTITITAMTNTPVYFQFQTVPTSDPYTTMQAALSPSGVLGPQWEDIAYSSFANIANTQSFVSNANFDDDELLLVPLLLVGLAAALALSVASNILLSALRNGHGNIKDATETTSDAAAPPPPSLKNILLVDANGADKGTQALYDTRSRKLYPAIESGKFRNNYSKLVGTDATKTKFTTALADVNVKLVSAAGHGNLNRICGYTSSGVSPWTPILETADVKANPALAKGKIFHLLGCQTASGLGATLVANGATAYIGYDSTFEYGMLGAGRSPIGADCDIVRALIDGKTVAEAFTIGRASYLKLKNKCIEEGSGPTTIGYLEHDRNALVYKGDSNAALEVNNDLSSGHRDNAAVDPRGQNPRSSLCTCTCSIC